MSGAYTIAKSRDGWIVSVHGVRVLLCKRREQALRAVRSARNATKRDALALAREARTPPPSQLPFKFNAGRGNRVSD
jgi:hypothetical protein